MNVFLGEQNSIFVFAQIIQLHSILFLNFKLLFKNNFFLPTRLNKDGHHTPGAGKENQSDVPFGQDMN